MDTSAHIQTIERLPFVVSSKLEGTDSKGRTLRLRTPKGEVRLRLEIKASHLTHAAVRALPVERERLLLLAPYVGPSLSRELDAAGVNFVDAAGNVRLVLGKDFMARIDGRKLKQAPATERGVRAPGFHVFFALLADADLAAAPVRVVARAAGVAQGTAATILRRLEQEGVLLRGEKGRRLARRDELMDRWLAAYVDVVRPHLLLGTYRTRETDPMKLETQIESTMRAEPWGFGGGAAAYRMNRHYRGPDTVVHVMRGGDRATLSRLHAIPDPGGTLTFLRYPGEVATKGVAPRTVHPLLVYTERVLSATVRDGGGAERVG